MKSIRLRRHLCALIQYGTPYKVRNVALVEMERILYRRHLRGLPYFAIIDPASVCGLKCPLCPTGRGDPSLPRAVMSMEVYRKIVDQIAPYTVKIALYNWGEPFLNPNICAMVRYAHGKQIATAISSNMNVLPREGAEALVFAGLDDLIVSCDGLTQKTYETYRIRGNLDRLLANVAEVQKAKTVLKSASPHIEFQFLVFDHNRHEIPQVKAFAASIGINCVRIVSGGSFGQPPSASGGRGGKPAMTPTLPPGKPRRRRKCYFPWRTIVVNASGQVDPCCVHVHREAFADASTDPLALAWNNERFQSARSIIAGGKPDVSGEIICEECNFGGT